MMILSRLAPVKVTTRVRSTVTRFDSKATIRLHAHTFALGVSPIDWDALAEDAADMAAACEGHVYSRNDLDAAPIEVEPIRSPRVATDGIPATATRISFRNYNSPVPCVRYLEAWVEEETGRVRTSYQRADELYRQGRVAILADKPPAAAAAPTPAPRPVTDDDRRYASRLAYLASVSFNPDTDGNDWHATESRRQSRQLVNA